jgi:hypothetical protein
MVPQIAEVPEAQASSKASTRLFSGDPSSAEFSQLTSRAHVSPPLARVSVGPSGCGPLGLLDKS